MRRRCDADDAEIRGGSRGAVAASSAMSVAATLDRDSRRERRCSRRPSVAIARPRCACWPKAPTRMRRGRMGRRRSCGPRRTTISSWSAR